MPIYLYQNEDTGEIREVMQTIHEEHIYKIKGEKWNRLFTVPNMSVDSVYNEYLASDYINKTANKKGTVGDLMKLSSELSEKRKSKEGVDPIKEKFYEDYSKTRKGLVHPDKKKEAAAKKADKLGFKVTF